MDTIRVHPYHKVDVNALKVDGVEVTATPAELNKLDGVESIAAELDQFLLSGIIADLGAGGIVWTVSPYAATIEKMYSVIDGTITNANAGITLEIGGTAVTDGVIDIAADSTAGTADVGTPSALNVVAAGGAIEIIADNATTGAVSARVVLVMQRS